MASPGEQQNWGPAIRRFLDFVDTNCELEIVEPEDVEASPPTPAVTRPFMPLDKIRTYFADQNYNELRGVLGDLFPSKHIKPEDIFPEYIAVLCALLCAGKGWYIQDFKHHGGLSDAHMPFNAESPPAEAPSTPGNPTFWHDFCKEQWKFCPRMFKDLTDKYFQPDQILPIVSKKKLAGGGTANIWLVEIYPFYNEIIDSKTKTRLGGGANTFVLKEYSTHDARRYYENEIAAFNEVGSCNNIIKYYGSFKRGDTYNLLLEYADKGTLRSVFEREAPTSAENIISFWKEFFKLMSALHCIHQVGEPATPGGPQIFQGWHQDVKPENILVVSNGRREPHEWQYKLADLGLSHFKKNQTLRADSTSTDTYGTRKYGAPECSRPDRNSETCKLKVKQNIDIWSIGCIYSETIRWLVHGKAGVDRYQEERKTELKQLDATGSIDCFHDGEAILAAVWESHEVSVRELRKTDVVTDSVVHMVKDMLVAAVDRPSAWDLYKKQGRILKDAEKRKSPSSVVSAASASEGTQSRRMTHPPARPAVWLPSNAPPGVTHSISAPSVPSNKLRNDHNNAQLFLRGNDALTISPTTEYRDNRHRSLEIPLNIPQKASSSFTQPSSYNDAFPIPSQEEPTYSRSPGDPPWNPSEQGPSLRGASYNPQSPGYPYDAGIAGKAPNMAGSLGHHLYNHSPMPMNGIARTDWPTSTYHQRITQSVVDFHDEQEASGSLYNHYHNERNQSTTPSMSAVPTPTATYNLAPSDPFPTQPPPRKRTTQEIASSDRISIKEALDWKLRCKSEKTHALSLNKTLYSELNGRDHVFLIDDSNSMADHWHDVVEVFEALSYIVKKTDGDGIDLLFNISKASQQGCKETSELISILKSQKNTNKNAKHDIDFRLTEILEAHTAKLGKKRFLRKGPKPLSLYIFTDGMWGSNDVAIGPIRDAVQKLHDVRKGRKQIGIQFISFGTNPDGLKLLKHLDDGLYLHKDIVDTEPSDGNVWKMLLGAISTLFDNDKRPGTLIDAPYSSMAGPSNSHYHS